MNLGIEQARLRAGKSFKGFYLAVSICGALIIGAIAVTAITSGSESTGTVIGLDRVATANPYSSSEEAPNGIMASYGPAPATPAELAMVYFLVESEAQRTAVFYQVESGDWSLPVGQDGEFNFQVLVAATLEDDAKAASFLDDEEARLKAANADMKVIDLRTK